MDWRLIPSTFRLRGERWRVRWIPKIVYRGKELLGACNQTERIILLSHRIRRYPRQTKCTWFHELLHAAMPGGLTRRAEEKLVLRLESVVDVLIPRAA